jgi:spermidine/putrescine transport system ATP-binding protein
MGNRKVRFLNHIFDCVDDFAANEKVNVVVRPEDVKFAEPGKGMIDGVLTQKVFKGIHYEYIMMVGRNEVTIQSTRNMDTGIPVGVNIAPDLIHIMKKDLLSNVYDDAYIDNDNRVIIAGGAFAVRRTELKIVMSAGATPS